MSNHLLILTLTLALVLGLPALAPPLQAICRPLSPARRPQDASTIFPLEAVHVRLVSAVAVSIRFIRC